MSLESGTRIGPYEIVSLRGAGGMGEVYRARDTRLDRTIALKILPAGLAASEALRARFEREARAISALSHPNICALFDIGSHDGTEYLVMEYLDGESLAERLAKGPLPTSLVLRYGSQIAEGLQHAHNAGLTHRDLKPGNIMITDAGAKILDFGLAKFVEQDGGPISSESAPTQKAITAKGTIVGTFPYMSPEQLEGKQLDHRTDIFSLGVILYEMTTGQRPFRGESNASLMAAIISNDPIPVRSLRPDVSPVLERVIQSAIEKSAAERWQTAQDLGRQLRWISETTHVSEQAFPVRRRVPVWLTILITAVITGFLTWGALRLQPKSGAVNPRLSFEIVPPPGLELASHTELDSFAINPDGTSVAFVAYPDGGRVAIYVRDLGSFDVTKVEGTEGAMAPFWSSDGNWIGYSSRGKLWKTRIAGGPATEAICDITPSGARASWRGTTILFADTRGERNEIYRVSDTGGNPEKVTTLAEGEFRHSWPLLLPDGVSFIYEAYESGTMERTVRLATFGSDEDKVITRNVSMVRLLGDDRLAFVRDGVLFAQRIDLATGVLVGEPATLATDVAYFYPTAGAEFDASPTGSVVFRTNTSLGCLVLMDRKGTVTQTIDDENLFWDHSISPDGKKAAVTVVSRDTGLMDIWIYDLVRGVRDRFTTEPAIETTPSWAPDGRSIVYSQGEGGVFPHLVHRPINATTSEDLTTRDAFELAGSFSSDGSDLYFTSSTGKGNDILRLSMATQTIEPVLATEFNETSPAISPDGHWLAYSSNANGKTEVYLLRITGNDPIRIRVSKEGGIWPRWRGDGKELFFVGFNKTVYAAKPGSSGQWEDVSLEELFRVEPDFTGFDVTPDGQAFLVAEKTVGTTDSLFHVITGL